MVTAPVAVLTVMMKPRRDSDPGVPSFSPLCRSGVRSPRRISVA
jgi:hypothetical protein